MTMQVAIVNQSTLVSNNEAAKIAAAIQAQVASDFAPAWDRAAAEVAFFADVKSVPAGTHNVAIVDTIADAPQGVLGYHTEDQKGEWGIVAAKPELDAGAKVLTGDWSVASVLSHEVLELLGDPSCSFWASDGAQTPSLYCLELCDPVEAPTYEVEGVSLSNFVLPNWFDPQATKDFDHLGKLSAPFSLLSGGYVVYMTGGQEQQKYGDEFPDWRKDMKRENPVSRTTRRTHRRKM